MRRAHYVISGAVAVWSKMVPPSHSGPAAWCRFSYLTPTAALGVRDCYNYSPYRVLFVNVLDQQNFQVRNNLFICALGAGAARGGSHVTSISL
jgi:hypothetical protein